MPVEVTDPAELERPRDPRAGHAPRLEVDLAALAANWRGLAARAAPAECAAVVKADAYGLGLEPCARALQQAGCRKFFIAHLEEGLTLRRLLADGTEIFVLNGFLADRAETYAGARLVPVLNTEAEARAWAAGPLLPAALQIETGMNRLGLDAAAAAAFANGLSPEAASRIGLVMSHLACADDPEHAQNERQRSRLAGLGSLLPHARRSLANSGGICLGKSYHFDLVRPGIALFGGSPGAHGFSPAIVARLHARVLQVKAVGPGEAVGYGAAARSKKPRSIATLSAGYGDGIPRALSERGVAWIGGAIASYTGRVSMDSLALDISAHPEGSVREGGEAELFGTHIAIDDLAGRAGTIAYELLTRLGGRLHRVYK